MIARWADRRPPSLHWLAVGAAVVALVGCTRSSSPDTKIASANGAVQLDPRVPLIDAIPPWSTRDADQLTTASTWGGTAWLTAWTEHDINGQVMAERISPAAGILDGAGFQVPTFKSPALDRTLLAWTGSHWLVVGPEDVVNVAAGLPDIVARMVASDGTVAGGPAEPVFSATSVDPRSLLAIAGGPATVLLVWRTPNNTSTFGDDLMVARLSDTGTPVLPPQRIETSYFDMNKTVGIARVDGGWIVAWTASGEAWFATYSDSDIISAPQTFPRLGPQPPGTFAQVNPSIASRGGEALAVWSESSSGGVTSVSGIRLDSLGAFVPSSTFSFPVQTLSNWIVLPRASWDGTVWHVTWQDVPSQTNDTLQARRLGTDGMFLDLSPVTLLPPPLGVGQLSTSPAGDCLLSFPRTAPVYPFHYDAMMKLGSCSDLYAGSLSTEYLTRAHTPQRHLRSVPTSSGWLLAWDEREPGMPPHTRTAPFVAAGTFPDPDGTVDIPGEEVLDIVQTGSTFALVTRTTTDLLLRFTDAFGAPFADPPTPVASVGQFLPAAVGSADDRILVAWYTSSGISVVRLDASGAPAEAPFLISDVPGDPTVVRSVSVRGSPSKWLVTIEKYDHVISGRTFLVDGPLEVESGFDMPISGDPVGPVSVSFGHAKWLVLWASNDNPQKLFAISVPYGSASGAVQQQLSVTGNSFIDATVAATSTGWVTFSGRVLPPDNAVMELRAHHFRPNGVVQGASGTLLDSLEFRLGWDPMFVAPGLGSLVLFGYVQLDSIVNQTPMLRVFETGIPLGTPCTLGSDCKSGNCVDGVCCDLPCGNGNVNDCQACSVAAGAPGDGTCSPAKATLSCRPAATACDVAEYCDGTSVACPLDVAAVDGSPCGAGTCQAGACFVPPDLSPAVEANDAALSPIDASADASSDGSTTPSETMDASTVPGDVMATGGGCSCDMTSGATSRDTPLTWMIFGLICLRLLRMQRRSYRAPPAGPQ